MSLVFFNNLSFMKHSQIFEKPFRMLTGLELFLSDLLSFLLIDLTEAILTFFEKHERSIAEFMMLVRCLSITSPDSFIILIGIPSGLVVFLEFRRLISLFIFSFFASGKLFLRIRAFFSNLINTSNGFHNC